MELLIKGIVTNLGLPGVIISIIFIGIKMKPVTLISSSQIEMKLSTKDKRFYIRAIRIFSEIVFYTLFMLFISLQFYSMNITYYPLLTYILIGINTVIFLCMIAFDLKGITLFDLVMKFSVKWKIGFFLIFFIHFLNYFFISSYYFGTQFFSDIYKETMAIEEKIAAILVLIILYFVTNVIFYFSIIKYSYGFLGFKNNGFNNVTISIENETWYIFHPIENELFLLGDNSVLNDCTKFKFIEKTELLKKQIVLKNE
ncbi:hypothetical protein [Bacillus sp. FJAT-27445]|uniref:hypothetical protein n=1 Tax=Bacillus sp. FJAT-27445 TaxID=1679166 RepID=UPI000743CEA2|nr:hypothetical protein [Bacillus sp. FJAT-27445]